MGNSGISFRKDKNIGIVTLCRPEHQNAITSEIVTSFSEIKDQLGYGSDLVVLLITGEGKESFCMGTDADDLSRYDNGESLLPALQFAAIIGDINRPVIAAINGNAFDQGLELALACDLRIAADTARFALSHVANGIIPWDGGTQRLSRLVGRAKAMEMVLLGEEIDAASALEIGLVNAIVPSDELMPSALETAHKMAEKGPIALRYAKEAILKGLDMTLAQGLRLEADLYFLLHTTEDRTEGITAFNEKRAPKFLGK